MSLLPQGFEYFADAGKFMVLPDGRIAYRTERRTWAEIFLHSLPLDDHLYSQCVKPRPCYKFDWKVRKKSKTKKKECLTDGDKCDLCKKVMKTVIFRATSEYGKVIICQACSNILSYIESLETCLCCGRLQDCEPIVKSWHTGTSFPMCHDCINLETCQGCGVWSGGDLCDGCRMDDMW